MKFSALILCLLAMMFSVPAVYANDPPEVDANEVLRLGDMVQVVDRTWRADDTDLGVEALGPPADDNGKWFISVVSSQGCAACQQLKAKWKTDPHLLALANPEDTSDSWAHLNFYDKDDASQNRRWAGLKVQGYPTIYVQPPRNGKYGDPGKVVCQILGFDGDGKKLSLVITKNIAKYAAKNGIEARPADGRQFNQLAPEYGVNPPFNPPPRVDGPATSSGVTFPQLVYPGEAVGTQSTFTQVTLGFLIGLSVIGLIFGFKAYLEYRKKKESQAKAEQLNQMRLLIESARDKDDSKKAA